MMWFKSCPRCTKGDVLFEEEREGCRVRCAQCGFSREVNSRYEASQLLQQRRVDPTVATRATGRLARLLPRRSAAGGVELHGEAA